jgi:hypothetical protein
MRNYVIIETLGQAEIEKNRTIKRLYHVFKLKKSKQKLKRFKLLYNICQLTIKKKSPPLGDSKKRAT